MKYLRPLALVFITLSTVVLCGCSASPVDDSVSDLITQDGSGVLDGASTSISDPGVAGNLIIDDNNRANELNELNSPWHNLLNSRSYSGYIALMFKDGTDVRLRPEESDGPFVSLTGADIRSVNDRITSTDSLSLGGRGGSFAVHRGIQGLTEEQIELARANAANAGVELEDWNLFYTIEVTDPDKAERLIETLSWEQTVEYVHPMPIQEVATIDMTPDVSNEQDYLKPNETYGGLNVIAGWEVGATGKGVTVVDEEFNWNYAHEDLPVDENDKIFLAYLNNYLPSWYNDQKYIQHGTAVSGILGAYDNDIGIKGIVYDATVKLFQIHVSPSPFEDLLKGMLKTWLDDNGEPDELKPGDVIVIEVQSPGINTTSGCSLGDIPSAQVSGCVPEEAYSGAFDVIKDAVASGFVVVEGAGNGSLDLSSKDAHVPTYQSGVDIGPQLSKDSTGAIMVAASLGANHKKPWWTNCGKRVDVYAWGAGVVTTGYGDYGLEDRIEVKAKGDDSKITCFIADGVPGYDKALSQITDINTLDAYVYQNYPEFQGLELKYSVVGICPDGAFSYDDDPATPELDVSNSNKWYTSTFDGTSSAAAIIGGVAAQLQSYVKMYGYTLKINGPNDNFFTSSIYPKPEIELTDSNGKEVNVYLAPAQMRELLIASGTPAVGDEDCNIGVQPDVGKAIGLINENKDNKFTPVGIDIDITVGVVDTEVTSVSDTVVSGIRYDMDGDGRAELISFSRDYKWFIDLSSVQPPASSFDDGYGAWDLILEAGNTMQEAGMIFPVVHDYNSDGRADLALYDSINGKWYIKYTTSSMVDVAEGFSLPSEIVWDRIIDYTTDPAWKAYSRPVPGDYDGDHWLDPALQSPDGHWLIDFGGVTHTVEIKDTEKVVNIEYTDKLGAFDKDVKYLTDEQLEQAPGWAWNSFFVNPNDWRCIGYRVPDGVVNAENIQLRCHADDFTPLDWSFPNIYGSNDNIVVPAGYYNSSSYDDISVKSTDGLWKIAWMWNGWDPVEDVEPIDGYGDINCRPIPADYDGDGKDDRAVQCGTSWKIVNSSNSEIREIELDQAIDPVPAYVYAGGIKYQDTVSLYNYYKSELGGTKSSTIFDAPPPIGPYFAQCVKYWAPNASYCWDK